MQHWAHMRLIIGAPVIIAYAVAQAARDHATQ